ncbi:MAG: hypothetical protein FJX47_06330, partial [Alphaproteobacteria bacterium]|nr:hypothetical protein [Alphaproteobacteria bacterium]
ETLDLRSSIIRHTAEIFDPDIFIVDKEPLGLRGEVQETLALLKARGCRLVLGLRDVMDEPAQLVPEWQRKNVMPALSEFYDQIWVYGLPQVCDPLDGVEVPEAVRSKTIFTGYLPRKVPPAPVDPKVDPVPKEPYLLVTTGGGGDGEALVDWVLRAYETDQMLPYRALLVLGPFMQSERQNEFMQRVARLKRVKAITFNAHLERLMANAAGVIAMGGYNTFCEILSFDKRAIIVPRTVPRLEQFIRASRAQTLGLTRMLDIERDSSTGAMVNAIRALPRQRRPSEVVVPGLLEGLVNVGRLVDPWIARQAEEPKAVIHRLG